MDPCSSPSKSSHRIMVKPQESAMKTEVENRRADLLKEVENLSTLCGVKACAIIYSGDDPVPVTWPADPSAVVNIICEYIRKSEDEHLRSATAVQLRRLIRIIGENKEKIRRRRLEILESQKGTPPPPPLPIISPPPPLDPLFPSSSPEFIHSSPSPQLLDPSPQLLDPSPQLLDQSPQLLNPSPQLLDPSPPSSPAFISSPCSSPPTSPT